MSTKAIFVFALFASLQVKAQTSAFLHDAANTTGAIQTPLSIGNWANPTSVPQYTFLTADLNRTPLEIHSTRWSGGIDLTRDDPNGNTYMMSVTGWSGFGANLSLYNQSNQVKLLLNSDGNSYFNGGSLGIGTTNPGTFKLAVEGKIGAREIKVTLTNPWPDYVFKKKYALPSLASLNNT